jgi:hypothetical protein
MAEGFALESILFSLCQLFSSYLADYWHFTENDFENSEEKIMSKT